LITLSGISKSFKVAKRSAGMRQALKALFVREHETVEALRDISFAIGEGEIVGYIGPNGAGKSVGAHVICRRVSQRHWRERLYVSHAT